MNTAIDGVQPGQQTTSNAKPLWAAVGILGVAVLGMGGTMLYQGSKSALPAVQIAATSPVTTEPAKALSTAPAASTNAADDMVEKPKAQPAKPAPAPAQKVVKPTPKPTPATAPSVVAAAPAPSFYPAPVPVAVPQICTTCGSIESVTPVQRTTKADGPGVGAVAGGVAGAVLGSQVGQGNGRTAAAILGAIGGGLAGNAIEKNMKKETVYQVGVLMEDGSRRSIEVAQPPSVGSKVTVDGGSIRSNDGNVYRAPAPVVQRTNQPAPGDQSPAYQGGRQ